MKVQTTLRNLSIGIQKLQDAYRATLKGFYTQAEYRTSEGRIDMVVKTPKFCYVLEFKLDGTAEEALAQISDKNYTLPFAVEDQQIVRIGINKSLLSRYIYGIKKPSKQRTDQIINTIRQLGREMAAI